MRVFVRTVGLGRVSLIIISDLGGQPESHLVRNPYLDFASIPRRVRIRQGRCCTAHAGVQATSSSVRDLHLSCIGDDTMHTCSMPCSAHNE